MPHVTSRLLLEFPIDDTYPTGAGSTNVSDWYVFHKAIDSGSGNAAEQIGEAAAPMLESPKDANRDRVIVPAFDRPTQYGRINVSFTGGESPLYEIARQISRYAIILVPGPIPAGQMDIATSDK